MSILFEYFFVKNKQLFSRYQQKVKNRKKETPGLSCAQLWLYGIIYKSIF